MGIKTRVFYLCFIFSAGMALPAIETLGQAASQQNFIHIQHDGYPAVDLQQADLSSFRKIEIRAKDHEEKEHTYTGVALSDVLRKAGVPFGNQLRGANMGQYLLVRSMDGYQVIFALPELDSTFSDRTILLADQADGQPFPVAKGAFQIVVPGEKKHARWIWGVKDLIVKTAKD